MKRFIIILVMVVTFVIAGCESITEEANLEEPEILITGEEKNLEESEILMTTGELENELLRQLLSEENWEKLEQLFDEVEDELVRFVNHLIENDLLDFVKGSSIQFRAGRASSASVSTALMRLTGRYPEFNDIIREIGERGVIRRIFVSETTEYHVRISFSINTESTPFTAEIYGAQNVFLYVEGMDMEQRGYRRVRENWYMQITRPF